MLLEDGRLALDNLPLRAGQGVEVFVLPAAHPVAGAEHPLRGMVPRYDQATTPVAESHWDALQ